MALATGHNGTSLTPYPQTHTHTHTHTQRERERERERVNRVIRTRSWLSSQPRLTTLCRHSRLTVLKGSNGPRAHPTEGDHQRRHPAQLWSNAAHWDGHGDTYEDCIEVVGDTLVLKLENFHGA